MGSLVLGRNDGESIMIFGQDEDGDFAIKITAFKRRRRDGYSQTETEMRIGIDAPKRFKILREEIVDKYHRGGR